MTTNLVCDPDAGACLSGFDPSRMWHHACLEKPESGNRIVMLYEDGSGGFLAYPHDDGLIDQDGDDCTWYDEPGAMWAYLPNGFDMWCENRADEPISFPAQGIAARSDETRSGSAVRQEPGGDSHAPEQEQGE